jgi:hypothetical protein
MPFIRPSLRRKREPLSNTRGHVPMLTSGHAPPPWWAMLLVGDPIDAGWWWPSADYKRVPVSPFEAACQERSAARRRLLH